MIHKGALVEKAIRTSGYSITDIAKKLTFSRRHLYNLFQKKELDHATIQVIGRMIHHDFAGEIPGFVMYNAEEPIEGYGINTEALKEELDLLKDKYIKLLEEHKELLERLQE